MAIHLKHIVIFITLVLTCTVAVGASVVAGVSDAEGAADVSDAAGVTRVSDAIDVSDATSDSGVSDAAREGLLSRDEMTTLELERISEFTPPAQGAYVQGGTAASTGLVMAFTTSEEGSDPILLLDTETWQPVISKTENLSHANDMCYVDGEIFVLPMDEPKIIVLDEATLDVKRTVDVPQSYHAVGYDEDQDCFAAIYALGKGSEKRLTCDILDNTCTKVLRSFPVDTNLVYQGLAVHDGKVYYSCWKREEGERSHKTDYDDLLQVNDNVIYVYDFEGNLVDAMLIKMPEGYNTFEVENVSFLDDRMILQFNENLADENGTLMIGVYQANRVCCS